MWPMAKRPAQTRRGAATSEEGEAYPRRKLDAAAGAQQPKSGPSTAAAWPERSNAVQQRGPSPGARRPRAHLTALNYKQRSFIKTLCMGPSGALLAEKWRLKTSKTDYMTSYWLRMDISIFPVSYFIKAVVFI